MLWHCFLMLLLVVELMFYFGCDFKSRSIVDLNGHSCSPFLMDFNKMIRLVQEIVLVFIYIYLFPFFFSFIYCICYCSVI